MVAAHGIGKNFLAFSNANTSFPGVFSA